MMTKYLKTGLKGEQITSHLCPYFTVQPSTLKKKKSLGFPGGAVVENLPANAGDTGSGPGLGRSHMPRSD